jgi:glycoside/pentoside/hexuronide:cation symporter, GPH family
MVSSPVRPSSLRIGLLYAAGDAGASLTTLCLAFYWMYFLVEVARLPVLWAGVIHGSGYFFSAGATLWTAEFLDRRASGVAARCRLIVVAGITLAVAFALLWVPLSGIWRPFWFLLLSWFFHLWFALSYLSYLSLTPLLASTEKGRVQLNSYRFGSSMLLALIVLGLQVSTEHILPTPQRLLLLGATVALIVAVGSGICGVGLRRALSAMQVGLPSEPATPWGVLCRARIVWWAVGGNLAVWFMVQTMMVLTAFLCATAGISDARILLLTQICLIAAIILTGFATGRWGSSRMMTAAGILWCLGALCWWNARAPFTAAMLLGFGLGAATVISWARIPEALQRFSESGSGRADARAYAGLTVLRDLTSSAVPVLAALALNGRRPGSVDAGGLAPGLLIVSGLGSALALLLLQSWHAQRLPAAGAEIAAARR